MCKLIGASAEQELILQFIYKKLEVQTAVMIMEFLTFMISDSLLETLLVMEINIMTQITILVCQLFILNTVLANKLKILLFADGIVLSTKTSPAGELYQ